MIKQITKLPVPPTTDDPSNFDERADAFVEALPKFVTEANELATQANETLEQANEAKDAAQQSANEAASSASEAKSALDGATNAANSALNSAQTAQSAKNSAEQSATTAQSAAAKLDEAADVLEQMKNLAQNGIINDTASSASQTYSSKKIDEKLEAMPKIDDNTPRANGLYSSQKVSEEVSALDEKIAAAGKKGGVLPTPYESDLAMWDYMQHFAFVHQYTPVAANNAVIERDFSAFLQSNIGSPVLFEEDGKILEFTTQNDIISSSYTYAASLVTDDKTKSCVITKDSSNYYYYYLKNSQRKTLNKNSSMPSHANLVQSLESRFLIFLDFVAKDAYVYKFDGTEIKFAFKKQIAADKFSNYGEAYVTFNYLKIGKFLFKITDSDLIEVDSNEAYLPAKLTSSEEPLPLHRASNGFLINNGVIYDALGAKNSKVVAEGLVVGFVGRGRYVLVQVKEKLHVSDQRPQYCILDIQDGFRAVYLPRETYALNAIEQDGFAFLLLGKYTDRLSLNIASAIKIPTKFLTGKNYKG